MQLFNFGSLLLLSIWFWTVIDADGGELMPRYAVITGDLPQSCLSCFMYLVSSANHLDLTQTYQFSFG